MHLQDALLSPPVALTAWTVSAGLIGYSSYKLKKELDASRKIPLMGIMGAFIFTAQMINFTIPGTGSSGHLGGGLLLAALLGPWGGFLTISSVLIVQALFFADGGLLALGANIFNLGFFPCFIAFPFIYKPLKDSNPYSLRSILAAGLAVIVGLQLGSLAVVFQTLFSGITELTFLPFLTLMQPIHLAIGLVEAGVTIGIIGFIYKVRPDILDTPGDDNNNRLSMIRFIFLFAILSVLIGGFMSHLASQHPDGLEWSIEKTAGTEEIHGNQNALSSFLQGIQEKISFLPDYDFARQDHGESVETESTAGLSPGTTLSGIIGGFITFIAVAAAGFFIKLTRKPQSVAD